MNADRRKQIEEAQALLGKIRDDVQKATEIIEAAAEDENEYYENMPEGLQNGEKGTIAQEAAEHLGTLHEALEEFGNAIDDMPWDDVLR